LVITHGVKDGYVVQAVEERMARDMDGIKEAQGE